MTCPACGCKNIERGEHRCPHCGRRLDRPAASPFPEALVPPPVAAPPPAPAIPASSGSGAAVARAPEWKQEVSDRVEQFRSKRARQQGLFPDGLFPDPQEEEKSDEVPRPDPGQKVVAFEDFAAARIEPLIVEPPGSAGPSPRPLNPQRLPPPQPPAARERARWARRPVEEESRDAAASPAALPSPASQAASPTKRAQSPAPPGVESPARAWGPAPEVREELFPREIVCPNLVAPLLLRGLAAALDLAVAVIGVAVFLATFHLLGGALRLNHKAGGATALAVASVAAFYFFVYTCYGCETPGLQWMGLSVLDYEGRSPQGPQRFVRAVGMLLSAAALGLGYLWAFADEESLTWHDRMSKTFVTRDLAAPQHLRPPNRRRGP